MRNILTQKKTLSLKTKSKQKALRKAFVSAGSKRRLTIDDNQFVIVALSII